MSLVGLLCLASAELAAAGARLYKSGPIQITADGQFVWVANQDNDSVSRITTATDAVLEISLPDVGGKQSPRGLSVKENGSEVWVACHDSDRLHVLSGSDGSVLEQIDLPWGSGPFSVALSRDQRVALVTLYRSESLAVVDVDSRRVTDILKPVYRSPMGIAWTEDGNDAWVTHIFAPDEHPFVTRVNFSGPGPKVATQMQFFASDPRSSADLAAPHNIAEGGYLTTRGHPAQIPSATGRQELWLPMQYNNKTETRYSPDSTVQSAIRHLSLPDRRMLFSNDDKVILTAVHVHQGKNYVGPGWDARVAGPVDIGFSTNGSVTYFLHELSNDLVVMPSNTPAVRPNGAPPLTEIDVGDRPTGVAVSPTAEIAYVYNSLSRDVSVIDLQGLTELRRVAVTPVSGEVLPANLLSGAKIFHTSADPRVSGNNKVSCASCHIGGEHDGRAWSFHRLPGPHGPRAVPSLLGFARTMGPVDPATGFGQLHRSGDRDEVQDFEHTFQSVTMGGSGFLGAAVQPELGPPNAGRDAELDALADYVLSLDPLMRSPHRQADGSLTEAAIRGATFFAGENRVAKVADAGCITCHVPETGFVDFKFHDVGQHRPSNEEELNNRSPAWHVNTLTLVGVWATPLYDGVSFGFQAFSIRAVLLDLALRAGGPNPHGTPDALTTRQLRDLEEFVLSIDGNMTADEVRNARDTTPPRIVRAEATSLRLVDIWFSETVSRDSVENLANWSVEKVGGGAVPITAARWGDRSGDRVTLSVRLEANSEYRVSPVGPVLDAADTATGGTANALDIGDPANQRTITIEDTLTITLGASGYENLTVPVHDSSMVGPGLSSWGHDSVWLFPVSKGPEVNTGFVRFDWRDPILESVGIVSSAQIQDARVTLRGSLGDVHRIDARRTLQRWSDPPSGKDFNSNPVGGPTWNNHSHPSGRWNSAGAGALGGTGDSPADYNGRFDLANSVDASVNMTAINEEITFSGQRVTEAFRFWFDNPSLDYGYAFRTNGGSRGETRFGRSESELMDRGPYLTMTYDLSETIVITRETVIREGDVWRFFRGTQAPPDDWNELGFVDAAWESGPTGIGYGDGDDATILEDMRCEQGGGCNDDGYLAFFAGRAFEVVDPERVEGASLTVSHDDGFVVYLNGEEVGRACEHAAGRGDGADRCRPDSR